MGRPIAEIFDMVAGSSTGGILALGLTAPNHNRKPTITAKTAVNLYLNESVNIFYASWQHWISNMGGLFGPKYESTGLFSLIDKQVGNTKLSEALIPTLITGYYIAGESGVEFFSEDAKKQPYDKDCLMLHVGMATASAPVYFDSVDVDFAWGKLMAVADGSLYAHNPSLIAYATAKKHFPNKTIEIYSLGTGLLSPEELSDQLKGRGLLKWLAPIISHLQIGGAEADMAVLHKLLNEKGPQKFFRLNVPIDKAHGAIDDASEDNLHYLYKQGKKAIESPVFNAMIKNLQRGGRIG